MRAKNHLAPVALFIGLILLLAPTFTVAQSDGTTASTPQSAAPNSITTTTIPSTMFGMSAHEGIVVTVDPDPWPTMPITGLRLWDSNVSWAQINTANGVYDWTILDEWTAAAVAHSDQLIYTFGSTPAWASSDPTDENCDYNPGSCWPPDDLNSDGTGTDQHFIDYVTAIAQHAPSITYWEMWNTPHDTLQWNGSDAQLVRMVQDARTYILKYIPNATIISPANGQLNYSYPSGNCVMPDLMAGYLAAGLGKYIDVLAFHTYYTTVPEDIIPVIQCYQSTMATYGISSMPLWSTEGAWGTNTELPGADDQAGFLARLYLLLWSNGVVRHYWYNWDDANTGTLEVNGVTNTPGIAYTQVESWMSGRTMSTLCSKNSSGIWTCGFTGANGYEAQAVWHPGSNKTYTAPSQYINYLDLAGKTHTIKSGAKVTVGVEPILLQTGTSTGTPNFVFSEPTPFPEVNAGSTGTSGSLTISAENGFTGTVTLSCPSTFGAGSCSITPTSVKSYPATATLVINGTSFSAGAYTLAIQGTSGSITNTFNVPFNIGDYTLTGPATLSSNAGTNVAAKLTLTSEDSYSGKVNVTCDTSALSGATCSLSPASPVTIGSGAAVSVTATITIPSSAAAGTYNITISTADTTGAPSHSLTIPLTVTVSAAPNFAFSEPIPFPEVKAGSTGTSGSLTISAENGFTGTVTLSCPSTFGAGSCSISPTSVKSFPATATLVINGTSFSAGAYVIAVQGTSGSITNSFNVPFNVGDFSIAGPATLASVPAAQVVANLTLTSLDAYSGQVNATCDATALSGATCTLSPANPISIGNGAAVPVTATITIPSNAALGNYNISITATDVAGAPSHSLTTALTVQSAPSNFSLGAITPATQTIAPGQSATYNFNVQPVDGSFSNAVTLSCSGAPVISQCIFSPNPVTPGSSSAPVVMTIATTASSASLTPQQRGGTPFFYALWLALPGLMLLGTRTRGTRRGRFSLPVSLSALFLLAMMLASCGGGTGAAKTGGQQGTLPGTYTITVTGTSGTLTHQATAVTLIVSQ